MTTWSVVKDDTKEKRRPGRYFRYGILASLAVLAISLGLALTPGPPPEAPEPAFSERARAAALAETLQLRTTGSQLADSVSGAERQALLRTVTLLTTQARALAAPDQNAPDQEAPDQGQSTTSAASGTASGVPSDSAGGATAGPDSPAGLVAALSASGGQRLTDAEASDGGMARLLAAVGAAQLLQASSLAPAVGAAAPPAPALPVTAPLPVITSSAGTQAAAGNSCRAAPAASGTAAEPAVPTATPEAALAMTVKTEAETVYGYQVAVARLEGAAADSASQLLARHEAVLAEAEALSRAQCAAIPPREAGYTLGPLFLESPASGLGSLEAGTLPVYGDLVALSDGSTRQWAISGLLAAANRAVLWGADPGPLPGIVVNTAQLPDLPQDGRGQDPTAPPASTRQSDAG